MFTKMAKATATTIEPNLQTNQFHLLKSQLTFQYLLYPIPDTCFNKLEDWFL
jgi:hypothetical protein